MFSNATNEELDEYKAMLSIQHSSRVDSKQQSIDIIIAQCEFIYMRARTLQLLSWVELQSNCDYNSLEFKQLITNRWEYGYPVWAKLHYFPKWMNEVCTPKMRVKYFDSLLNNYFNWRKKGSNGYREIIER